MLGLLFLAMLGAIGSLLSGLGSMASAGEYDTRHSHEWMTLRLLFQGIAVALVLAAVVMQLR